MAHYLDPKNDLTFKRIFGEHPDLLMSFLNALMPLEAGQLIESLEYLPIEQVPANPLQKYAIVDVRCRDNRGRQFIVEMQMLWNSSFNSRMVFNASRAYVNQLDRSEQFGDLQPVYALAILNSIFDRKTDEFYHHYRIVNYLNTDEVIRGLEFVMIELPKFRAGTWTDRRMAVLWLRFLKEVKKREAPDDLKDDPEISRALDLCEEGAYTEAQLNAYEKYWDIIRVEHALASGSKADGVEEGKAIGREEGRKEERSKIAVNCRRNGFSVEQIQAITGLSGEEVREILRQFN
ncbi:MAG: Rpn family recombination-promoting nuclease/putative transposase [Tannerellaceae bacterium]|jgi:predicted transposase/invertase (TIGR01784 family)|nr:Rpn family recombination-promoting nuclease/putative transposase [Tannerellaceae bacterium]